MAATVRIGTCSWADEALSKYFYPPKLPAKERLAWYAEHFDTVEVDSTFYRLPGESMVQGWAERTPDGFTMHVKAFGLMTRHPVPAAARHRVQGRVAGVPRVGARAARRGRDARRVPAPLVARRREPRRE